MGTVEEGDIVRFEDVTIRTPAAVVLVEHLTFEAPSQTAPSRPSRALPWHRRGQISAPNASP